MDEQRQDNQLEPIYNSSVQIQDVALKTYWEQWVIETGGGRGSGRSMLVVRHDVDIVYLYYFIQKTMKIVILILSNIIGHKKKKRKLYWLLLRHYQKL